MTIVSLQKVLSSQTSWAAISKILDRSAESRRRGICTLGVPARLGSDFRGQGPGSKVPSQHDVQHVKVELQSATASPTLPL
jgi:hypothetical protein